MLIKIKSFFPVKFKTYLKRFKKFNAHHDLDKKLLKYINYKNGFYIDCGANDGVNQSTTWYFERYLKWNGVLIEPIPEIYDQLIKNRGKKNHYYNCALVNENYNKRKLNFVYNKKDSLQARAFMSKSKLKKNEKIISAKTETLENILNNIKTPKLIDLFSLDVEGYEFEVLEGINFNTQKFKYIVIETEFPKKMNNFLKKRGYNLVERLSNYKSLEKPDYGDYLYNNFKI